MKSPAKTQRREAEFQFITRIEIISFAALRLCVRNFRFPFPDFTGKLRA